MHREHFLLKIMKMKYLAKWNFSNWHLKAESFNDEHQCA